MKETRHLSIKYHYVTLKLNDETITAVTYQPTKEMVADYLSKPLQGSLFRKHRNAILGITEKDEAEALEKYQKRLRKWLVRFNTFVLYVRVGKMRNPAAEPRGDTTRPLPSEYYKKAILARKQNLATTHPGFDILRSGIKSSPRLQYYSRTQYCTRKLTRNVRVPSQRIGSHVIPERRAAIK